MKPSPIFAAVRAVEAGEEIVIARAGRPAPGVGLTPEAPRRRLGLLAGEVSVPDDFDEPLLDEVLALFEGRG